MLGVSRAALLGTLSFARQTYGQTVISLGPISYWQLSEAGGTTIVDEKAVQNGAYHGTIQFGTAPIVLDSPGTSVGFNGTNAYGEIPHNAAFAVPNGTIAFAVQADSVSGQRMLVAKDGGLPLGGLTVDINDGRLRAYLRNAAGGGAAQWLPDVGGAVDISTGVAHHAALTWGGRGAELWFDGELVASNTELTVGLGSNSANLFLAAYPGPTAFADVIMDEVAFFDRQLTPDQIQSLARPSSVDHQSPPSQALPDAPATSAYWVDPISGSDSATATQARSATTSPSSSPWRTFSKAISEWNAGNLGASASGHVEIILRGGLSYERGKGLTITRSASSGSHLFIKGYRDDIQAGTRGGTGKYTGAKGWFCLRGNIEALETAGWEVHNASRQVYRTTGTFSLTGNARGMMLGASSYNWQLVPTKGLNNLDTNTTKGVNAPCYTGPGVTDHTDGRIYLRTQPNEWTNFFSSYHNPSPSWNSDPRLEPYAIFDDTPGLVINGANWIDLQFFKIEYWRTGINHLGSFNNLTVEYVHTKSSVYSLDADNAGTIHHLTYTHCDFVINLAPWIGWQWVKENTVDQLQSRLQGRGVRFTPFYVHHLTIQHCRIIRSFDGGGWDNGASERAPHDIVFENNHLFEVRDDGIAVHSSMYDSRILYNYFHQTWQGVGRVGRPGASGTSANLNPGTMYIGFNIFDLRLPHFRGRPGEASGEFNSNGASALAEDFGLQWGRVDPQHSIANDEISEYKYYNNLAICGKDESNVGIWSWKDGIKNTGRQEERYNNISINVEGAEYHGRSRTQYVEQDYNMWFGDPSGSFSQNKVTVNIASGGQVSFSTWAAFRASGANYNETKHSNGDGPGSPSGWEANGVEADPDFVAGKWESIVSGDLSTYLPASVGNCRFAVPLTTTGWPGTEQTPSHVGPYQPGDIVTKIGPEQGLWRD